jgi:hypothetical protein
MTGRIQLELEAQAFAEAAAKPPFLFTLGPTKGRVALEEAQAGQMSTLPVDIAAFGLDQGGSIGALLSQGPVTPALAHLSIDKQGFAWLPEDDFVDHFAADVDPVKARVMYAVQQPLSATALQDVMGVPAWKALPSWYLVADGDQAIPPDAERLFA